MVGKSKNRRRTARHFLKKFSTVPSTFNKCKQNRSASEKRDGHCHIFANSCWAILPPLLLADGWYFGIFRIENNRPKLALINNVYRCVYRINCIKQNYFYIKLEETLKNLKIISGSYLGLDLSNHPKKYP
jgi:hypothetical protein